ncbi:MAG: acyltransferase family protein [Synergistaceae bacterium]|nr:acyltransferase family protein [Synergistaceae bacterium]
MNKDRIIWLDCFRVVACFAVIFAHTAIHAFIARDPSSLDWHICNCCDVIGQWANYAFFMISGVFFLDPDREISIDKLYSKYIKKLAIVFLFWFILNNLFFLWYGGKLFSSNIFASGNIFVIARDFFLLPTLHLWFLPMIIGFYISVPLLRCITQNEKILPYCIFVGILAALLKYFNVKIIVDFARYIVAPCLPFILGYYLMKCEKIRGKTEFALYALGIIGYLSMVLPTAYLSYKEGKPNIVYLDECKFAMAVAIFCFFKCRVAKINFSPRAKSIILFLSSHTLGIYLLQTPLRCLVHRYLLPINSINPLFSIPVVAIITFLISLAVTVLLKKIPWFNKYFI